MQRGYGVPIRRLALAAIAALVAGSSIFGDQTVQIAQADPTTLDDAKAQLQKLEAQEAEIGEQYDQVKLQLGQGRDKVARLNRDVAAQQAKVERMRGQATTVALTRFQSRGVDTTVQLMTSSDPESFLNQMSTARKVDDNMNSLLQDFQAQQANLSDLRRSAAAEVAALTQQEKQLAEFDGQLKAKVRESEALISRLTQEQQDRLKAGTLSRSEERAAIDNATTDGSADARALAAVRYALSKVSSGQYVWGAAGPSSFDCSGLMLAAYRSVGVSLPHSSTAQYNVGRRVPLNAMKPGDLIFFYSPIHHVGMYIGGGRFVHARNPRNDLEVDGVYAYGAPVVGAVRVLG